MMDTWTHYHITDEKRVSVFELGKCETCGADIQEVNSIGSFVTEIPKLEKVGLVEYKGSLPGEIYYSDATDLTECDKCP